MEKTDGIILELTLDQAKVVERALELFFRIHIGQFDEIKWALLHHGCKSVTKNSEGINAAIDSLRGLIFPELMRGESFNIDCDPECHNAYNIYQAIRYANAWLKNPEGGFGVNFDPPFPNGLPIPKCYAAKIGG